MGQHKHNPTAIASAKGKLPPKKRAPQLTKRQAERQYCPNCGGRWMERIRRQRRWKSVEEIFAKNTLM